MRIIVLSMILFVCQVTYAKVTTGSEYAPKPAKLGDLERICKVISENEGGSVTYSCPIMKNAQDLGYALEVTFWEHGVAADLKFHGKSVLVDQSSMNNGEMYKHNLPQRYKEIAWADWGVSNGVFQWRYALKDGRKTPFALIFRRAQKVFAYSENSSEPMKLEAESSSLSVIKLDGLQTKTISKIDSIKAYKNGESANDLADQCADSIIGQGNHDACQKFQTE
jgi:hypothetical protein